MKKIASEARSYLFLPADRLQRLDKAFSSGAHMVILDLEDAVAPSAKAPARVSLGAYLKNMDAALRARVAVRINAAGTRWHAEDMALLQTPSFKGLGAVMLAKSESVAQLSAITSQLGDAALLPLVESAKGLAALDLIARVPGVARLVFGHLDFQADLGMQCGSDERELDSVRFEFVSVSRQSGLPGPVDGVTTDLQGPAQLEHDAHRSLRFGFTAKLCIHPSQVARVNALLGPTPSQVDWAKRVLAAAGAQNAGVFQFEGSMVDAPVLARAHRYLQLSC